MGRENGKILKILNNVINMRVIIHLIKSMELECFNGQVEMFTKVSTKRMSEMGMER